MLIYGDPAYEENITALLERLKAQLDRLPLEEPGHRDGWRAILIMAGQIEQAAHDHWPETPEWLTGLDNLTDSAAQGFEQARSSAPPSAGLLAAAHHTGQLLDQALALNLNERVRVKLPEGFAFYALYPEQYALAAQRWLAAHSGHAPAPVLVVGVRSIGTTLSAVVAHALTQAGWSVRRLTVRPQGHPFAREVALDRHHLAGACHALVVDEGPGHSGSSMAAVAAALVGAGLPPERVSFLPGHSGSPGPAASAEVRRWWATTPRYTARLEELTFGGQSLATALAALPGLFEAGDVARTIEEVGGGLWRKTAYHDEAAWPAAYASFERPKYLISSRNGARVLCKFGGLASGPHYLAEQELRHLHRRAAHGYGPAPLLQAHGFVARLWTEGRVLDRRDKNAALIQHLGKYIGAVSGPAAPEAERASALEQLEQMVYWNLRETTGESQANWFTTWLAEGRAELLASPGGSYGDGQLSPCHWVTSSGGGLVKTGGTCRALDHSIIGPQPLTWDLAGACVEWNLDPAETGLMLDSFGRSGAGGRLPSATALAFYRLAYSVFRLGLSLFCQEQSGHDPAEQARLRQAADYYTGQLHHQLTALRIGP